MYRKNKVSEILTIDFNWEALARRASCSEDIVKGGRIYENRPLWRDRREDGLRMDCVCKGAKKIPRGSPGDFIQLEYIEMAL